MKTNERIVDALLTVDDEALGRAFKAAYTTAIGHNEADNLFNRCIAVQDESYLAMVLMLETIFTEEEEDGGETKQ